MAIQPFLAMTAAEIQEKTVFPEKTAWMACHFSSYGTGLSNLPVSLPPDSLLILNDRTPIHRHDPELITRQLERCIAQLHCWGLLLDFQRPGYSETAVLVKHLAATLTCPLAVTEAYAADCSCGVFLPPVPPSTALEDHLAPWTGRETWLELALEGEVITLTEQGADSVPLPYPNLSQTGFREEALHCHYQTQISENRVEFTLWRTEEDLHLLLADSENYGVTAAVGLYQELHGTMT